MSAILAPLILGATDKSRDVLRQHFATATEVLARSAVANCASHLVVPRLPRAVAPNGGSYEVGRFSPILRKRIKVLDPRDTVWDAVKAYFGPVISAVRADDEVNVNRVAWYLYLLMLASRSRSQIYLNVPYILTYTDYLIDNLPVRERHAHERLAFVRGAFALFVREDEIPGMVVLADRSVAFRERLEDILEDAYLLEAATLRRFISFDNNRASIRRDLRRLLGWLVRNRPWAKGVLQVAQQAAALPSLVGSVAAPLAEMLGVSISGDPVVLHGDRRPWEAAFPDGPDRYMWYDVMRPLRNELDEDGNGRLINDTYIITRDALAKRRLTSR